MTRRPVSRRRWLTLAGGSALAGITWIAGRRALAQPRRAAAAGLDSMRVEAILQQVASWPNLRTLLVAHRGEPVVAEAFRGAGIDRPTNIKSVAKTVIAALTGAAIDRGLITGVDAPIVVLLGELVPANADPRLGEITVDHLLTMRAGLERTSGPNYGRWVTSDDWVQHVLTRPFVAEPGGRMLYSTGSYHLLSAILTRVAGRSTFSVAREWLGDPLGIEVPAWDRDPQGIYLGGNNMALTPRALLTFGEMYRRGGMHGNRRVLSEGWVHASWEARTRSYFTGHPYGYGWFITRARGHRVYYAWGYGGQMIHVVPDLALTVVVTSDPENPSGRTGYARQLHRLVADGFVAAAEESAAAGG